MSTSCVAKKLEEINDVLGKMSDEEFKELLKNRETNHSDIYNFLCENVLGLTSTETSEELNIYSPEFLRQT